MHICRLNKVHKVIFKTSGFHLLLGCIAKITVQILWTQVCKMSSINSDYYVPYIFSKISFKQNSFIYSHDKSSSTSYKTCRLIFFIKVFHMMTFNMTTMKRPKNCHPMSTQTYHLFNRFYLDLSQKAAVSKNYFTYFFSYLI